MSPYHLDQCSTFDWPATPKEGIVHFTVTGGNKAGVDIVWIQPLQLYYVNHVVLNFTGIFQA